MSTSPTNILQAGEPSRSALRVATLRAAHQLLDEPIVLDDPLALPLLGPARAAALREDPFVFNDPMSRGLRAALVARSRLAEDELARSVAAGVRQYVVLGAGLDTFAARNVHAAVGLRVFEVDHPATQRWKLAALQQASIAMGDTAFVPVDFEHDDVAEALLAAGYRRDQPAFFAWLGVTVYLSVEAVLQMLAFVAALPTGSGIVFDYRPTPSLLSPIERLISESLEQQITAEGEPWVSVFDPASLQRHLRELGFGTVDELGPEQLNARYFFRRKDGLRTGAGFRLVCAWR